MFVPSLSWQSDHLYIKTDKKYRLSHLPLLLRVDAVVCIVMVMVVTATHSACENRISF
eukprot:COSAG06_NODE_1426_length_9494_cov_8.250985_10_plen_58_part_00